MVDNGRQVAEPNDATPFLPERTSLKALREASAECQGCHLWRHATQTVFGDGQKKSRVMFVGEQPGDKEDRAGRPFVGPAGRELDRALEEVGIGRAGVYVTNVVKHFQWVARGKRRIHQKPNWSEIAACRPWLVAERGRPLESDLAELVLATVHPSSILRQRTDEDRYEERRRFTEDLRVVAETL